MNSRTAFGALAAIALSLSTPVYAAPWPQACVPPAELSAHISGPIGFEIDGGPRRTLSASRDTFMGHEVAETPDQAGFFARMFRKGGHVLVAVNYAPQAISSLDGAIFVEPHDAYVIRLFAGDICLKEQAVPPHWPGQEWIWESQPQQPNVTPQALMAQSDIPRKVQQRRYYTATSAPYWPPRLRAQTLKPFAPHPPYRVLDTGVNHARWRDVGKHDEIYNTVPLSAWALSGDDRFFENIYSHARGQLAVPLHLFAKEGTAPPDLRTPYYARTYLTASQRLGPYVPLATPNRPLPPGEVRAPIDAQRGRPQPGQAIEPDTAHLAIPQLAMLRLTGHPYWLYSAQHFQNWCVWSTAPLYRHWQPGWSAWWRRPSYGDDRAAVPGALVVDSQQQRALGKCLMHALDLAQLTPEQTPEWLLPRSYFQQMIADTARFIARNYVPHPRWQLGLTGRNYRLDQKQIFDDAAWDMQDTQVLWAFARLAYAGYSDYEPLYRHALQKFNELYHALGVAHAHQSVRHDTYDHPVESWAQAADIIEATPKFVSANSIHTHWEWNEPRALGMVAAIWQLAQRAGDQPAMAILEPMWKHLDCARIQHNWSLVAARRPQEYKSRWRSRRYWDTQPNWQNEGPQPSGACAVLSDEALSAVGAIAPLGLLPLER